MHFDARPNDLGHLVQQLHRGRRLSLSVLHAEDPAAELGRAVEAEVFGQVFGNDVELLRTEYTPYDTQSRFVVVSDHELQLPVGVMRIVVDGPAGLKSLHDTEAIWGEGIDSALAHLPFPVDRTSLVDIATLATLRHHGSGRDRRSIAIAMYRALVQLMSAADVHVAVSIMDLRALRALRSVIGGGMVAIPGCEPKSYLDSPLSVPTAFDNLHHMEQLSVHPELLQLFYGAGTELPGTSQPEWSVAGELLAQPCAAHDIL